MFLKASIMFMFKPNKIITLNLKMSSLKDPAVMFSSVFMSYCEWKFRNQLDFERVHVNVFVTAPFIFIYFLNLFKFSVNIMRMCCFITIVIILDWDWTQYDFNKTDLQWNINLFKTDFSYGICQVVIRKNPTQPCVSK